MKTNGFVRKSTLLLAALGLMGGFSLWPLHAQHQHHGGAKKGDAEQSAEDQDEHEGPEMGGMEHGMKCGKGGMGGMSHGMAGMGGGGGENWDRILQEVETTKNPKATARKLRMKADLMKADAEVLEKYAKELETGNP
ncbi:conserved exported protein of unknown function [Methylacidimicrobium sp. AP8]|uniref:hypothetical protein n=1 Tax=Methylacidimicrobium sp. AP8 TaxID=2730359 RepID=UPI0018C1B320|nr:hypothetical protein [Methylacidimicrobium sp. AP8]CAB4244532.1 conserved exported protein of unknown function [Methylacidimicrobium sp. AP8]